MTPPKYNIKVFLWLGPLVTMLLLGFLIIKKSIYPYCANSLSCKESLEFAVDNNDIAVFNGTSLVPPAIDLDSMAVENSRVLGSRSISGDKHIYVDLSTQTLKAYEGNDLFLETKISSGKWFPTPNGEFTIWKKIRATKMSGGEGADYYYLPNVPYVMFFGNAEVAPGRGFALHGAYWHNNFGYAMSHGCVNLRIIDAKKLYEWANRVANGNDTNSTEDNPGTKITIYGKAP